MSEFELGDLTDHALECRDLQHSWPRPSDPHQSHLIKVDIERLPHGQKVLTRTMTCAGGCGVSKTQVFLITADGRMRRQSAARYSYPESGYTMPRTDGPVDREVLRLAIVTRLYPELRW